MDMLEHTRAFGHVPPWGRGLDTAGGAGKGLKLGRIAWDQVQRLFAEFLAETAEINRDPRLSEAAKAEDLTALAEAVQRKLAMTRGHADTLRREAEALKRSLTPGAGEVSEVMLTAIWAYLPEDQLSAEATYREALAAGDQRTVAAIEALPLVHPARLAPDKLARLAEERLSVDHSEEARQLKDLL